MAAILGTTKSRVQTERIDMNGLPLYGLPAPVDDSDAATKAYADGLNNATAYTPSVSGDWSPAPTTVAEALDQLAARLSIVEP